MPDASRPSSRLRKPATWIPIASAALALTLAAAAWSAINSSAQQGATRPTAGAERTAAEPPTATAPLPSAEDTQGQLLPGVPFPTGYTQIEARSSETVGQPITVTRFQDQPEPRRGGEQISVARTSDGDVLGYVDFRLLSDETGPLLTAEEAESTAFELLNEIDPGYAAGLTVQWVDSHEESILDADGIEQTLAGMKVKTIHDNGRYTWLIYGSNGRLIAYERDMPWDGAARVTGVWLEEREGVDGPR